MLKEIYIRNKKMPLPAFFPDATFGYVRGVSSEDLINCGIKGLVVNTYHLLHKNLIEEIKIKKGIHKYMNFNGIIISDSGGFQVMSLIHDNPENGKIYDDKVIFKLDSKKVILTPELCVKMQFEIKSDIIMCLDDCTYPDMLYKEQKKSVERTISWACRCKIEFERLTSKMKESEKPLIFGIIQGGKNLELRKKCAEELIKIGFDGYAFGGWPAEDGKFLHNILKYTAELMPDDKLKYAMGVGKPEDIVYCTKIGYNMFDCVIPTREARNNRLYEFKKSFLGTGLFGLKNLDEKGNFYKYVRVRNLKYKDDKKPISNNCDCYACRNFSRAQIYKMFKERNAEAVRLATMHNLRFYSKLMERLQKDN